MGRKIDMKKIEDITRCQVTFSKRRSSVMKKANEVAVCCDVDVAFVAFSPSGRISKFCNQKRIEDVLQRYVDLPPDMRLNQISNVQEKMEKVRQLGHINGDNSKLQYLDKQIENLELQIKKSGLELQILETDLRDYEVGAEQEASLHQLCWCERNLKHSLQKVIERKNVLAANSSKQSNEKVFNQAESEHRVGIQIPSNFDENQQLMQLDPWISPYNTSVPENIYQDLFDQAKYASTNHGNIGPSNFRTPCNFPILDSQNIFEPDNTSHTTMEQSLMVDQPILNFHQQNNVDAWKNTASVFNLSDAIHKSSQSSCNIPAGPRFTSTTTITTNSSRVEMTRTVYDEIIGSSHLRSMEIGQINNNNNNVGEDIDSRIETPFDHQQKEVFQDTRYDSFLPEDTFEDDTISTSEVQSGRLLWEWDDLLLDGNINLQHIFSDK